MTMTMSGEIAGQDMNETTEGTMLISQDYGMRMTMDTVDPNSGETSSMEAYILPPEKTMVTVIPDTKNYWRTELDDTPIEKMHRGIYDPGSMLKEVLACKYESLGRSRIDGVKVEGFETTDPNYRRSREGPVDVKIWVDVRTRLPVRFEMDMETEGEQMHAVVHNFQWNYPVTAADFTPVIPADYTEMKMPAVNEEGAIAGLKLCADLTGRYPERLDFTTAISLMDELEPNDPNDSLPLPPPVPPVDKDEELLLKEMLSREELNKLPREEQIKKIEELTERLKEHVKRTEEQHNEWKEQYRKWKEQVEKEQQEREERLNNMETRMGESTDNLMTLEGAVMFYMMLAQEGKDPAYYGNVVTPQDATQVVMRWKVSDTEYRVIFGSLHAETVDAATLAELEKSLPR